MPDRVRRRTEELDNAARPERFVQRKLEVGKADDPLEREADATAALVMQRLASGSQPTPEEAEGQARRSVFRAVDAEALVSGGDSPSEGALPGSLVPPVARFGRVRRDPDGEAAIGPDGGAVDTTTEQAISSSRGRPLDDSTRSSMESAFGTDFSAVRVHTGPQASDLNSRLSAKAFTTGADVFVRSGDYAPKTPAGQRLLAHELTHVVQQSGGVARINRLIMTRTQWLEASARFGRARGPELLKVDETLVAYNGARDASPSRRLNLLEELDDAIADWMDSKDRDPETGEVISIRAPAVKALRTKVDAERIRLRSIPSTGGGDDVLSTPDVSGPAQVNPAANDIYKRAVRTTHKVISKREGGMDEAGVTSAWQGILAESRALRAASRSFDLTDPKAENARHEASALHAATRGLAGITYRYHDLEVPDRFYFRDKAMRIMAQHAGDIADHESAETVEAFIERAQRELTSLAGIALGGGDDGGDGGLLDGDSGDLIEELLAGIGDGTGISGYFGTQGLGNEGTQEFAKSGPMKTVMESRTDAASNDQTSGTSDAIGSAAGATEDVIAIIKAVNDLKNGTDAEKRAAKAVLVGAPTSLLSKALAFVGGVMTAARSGRTGPSGSFGFTSTGTDASTEVKLAGDFAGLFTGIIDSIKKTLDVFHHFGDQSEKQKKLTPRKVIEDLGLYFKKVTGALTSLANNSKALTKLGYQIEGGGQIAADAVDSVAKEFMGKIVPALNLVMGCLETVQQGYKLVRIGLRRRDLTARIAQATSQGSDLTSIEAMEFAHGTLIKRTDRIGINLGHALSSVAGGALTLSGVGTAPAMALSLSSTAARIGQVGIRKGKQKIRDRVATTHEEGDTYAEWEHGTRKKAAEKGTAKSGARRFAQFQAAIKIKFKFNWDKSSENKKSTVKAVALEAIRMDDDVVFTALGIKGRIDAAGDDAEAKLAVVMEALEKRD